jgi:hypothetical protein
VKPVGAAEHRRHFGIERAALFELDLQAARRGKSCEFGERPKWREAQGTRVSGQVFGSAFLLGTFLWRSKEKYLAGKAKPVSKLRADVEISTCPDGYQGKCISLVRVKPAHWITALFQQSAPN